MLSKIVVVAAAALAAAAAGGCSAAPLQDKVTSIGSGVPIYRAYTQYVALPTTAMAAQAAGWEALNGSTCDPALGVGYVQPTSAAERAAAAREGRTLAASKNHPLTLYFTPAGQPSGAGVTLYGSAFATLVKAGFLMPVPGQSEQHELSVAFRAPGSAGVCATTQLPQELGDRLVVSPGLGGAKLSVPITPQGADAQNYQNGSCFAQMGWHAFHWLTPDGKPSWKAEDLMPIVPMYYAGRLNAFFFASATVQQGLTNAHDWDPIALENIFMCKNWCTDQCTFHGTHFWSTMHMFLGPERTQVECPGDCSISCCKV